VGREIIKKTTTGALWCEQFKRRAPVRFERNVSGGAGENEAFVGRDGRDAAGGFDLAGERHDASVIRFRFVVRGDDARGLGFGRHLRDVARVGVAPAKLLDTPARTHVLVVAVLAVRDPDVRVASQIDERPVQREAAVGFVVGREGENLSGVLDAVAVGLLRVVELAAGDLDVTLLARDHDHAAVEDRVELHLQTGLFKLAVDHGEDRRVHLSPQNVLQALVPLTSAVEGQQVVEDGARHVQGFEERVALDVVPVHVALQDRAGNPLVAEDLRQKRDAEFAQASSHVEDEERPSAANLDAGGVTSEGRALLEGKVFVHPGVHVRDAFPGEEGAIAPAGQDRAGDLVLHARRADGSRDRAAHSPELDRDAVSSRVHGTLLFVLHVVNGLLLYLHPIGERGIVQ